MLAKWQFWGAPFEEKHIYCTLCDFAAGHCEQKTLAPGVKPDHPRLGITTDKIL